MFVERPRVAAAAAAAAAAAVSQPGPRFFLPEEGVLALLKNC